MNLAKTSDAADWIESRLHPFAVDVGSIIPVGFDAYVRIFHPPYRRTADGEMIPVRWRDIAAANNRSIAAEMQIMDISAQPSRFSSSGEELWNEQPRSGTLPREIAERLAAILPLHTQTPDSCWFGVWDGFGGLRIPGGGVGFSVPQRYLLLLHGRVDDVPTTLSVVDWSYQSPNLWWPDDKAWCVATEIDFNWTYVGGSHACVQQILNDSGLEALPTHTEEGNALEK